ncbi:MAG: C40 family peptidase [Solirubrobacteraceae bacterium]
MVAAIGPQAVTIEQPGRTAGPVDEMVAYATRLGARNYPYVFGGGHARVQKPSNGGRGASVGYDCSGAMAAVLAAGGLWPKGSGVPGDAGIIQELRARKRIAPGGGRGPDAVTLYDDPGRHIFMNIAGRFFDTGYGKRGGADWAGGPESTRGWKIYHVLPSYLKQSRSARRYATLYTATSKVDSLWIAGLSVGADVVVSYRQDSDGTLALAGVSYPGALSVVGTVTSISNAADRIVLNTTTGEQLTLMIPLLPGVNSHATNPLENPAYAATLTSDVYVGDTVQATYTTTNTPGQLVAHTITVTTPAPRASVTGIVTALNDSYPASITVTTAAHQTLTFVFPVSQLPQFNPIASGLRTGVSLTVSYVAAPDGLQLTALSYSFASS